MTHPIFRAHFLANIKSAIARADYVKTVDHQGLKGQFREIFASDMLAPLLPPNFGIGRGKIVDSYGSESGECDVIIYDRSVMPPLLFDTKTGLFPVEACIYVIEVKSILTSDETRKTINNFDRIWDLKPLDGVSRPRTALFAFASDLTQKTEIDRYLDLDKNPKNRPNPACLVHCIVGRTYFYFNAKSPKVTKKEDLNERWTEYETHEKYEEVLNFLGGVANTMKGTTLQRSNVFFGKYFIDH